MKRDLKLNMSHLDAISRKVQSYIDAMEAVGLAERKFEQTIKDQDSEPITSWVNSGRQMYGKMKRYWSTGWASSNTIAEVKNTTWHTLKKSVLYRMDISNLIL